MTAAERNSRYYAKNKEKIAAYQKEWYAKNRETALAKSAARAKANPAIGAANTARYRERHPEKIAAYNAANKKRQSAEYRERKGEELKERMRKWLADNKPRAKQSRRDHYENNKAAYVTKAREWQERNPEKVAAQRLVQCAKRRADKLQATPAWVNKFFISEIYGLARRRNKLLTCGVKWHVDHIVPLRGKRRAAFMSKTIFR